LEVFYAETKDQPRIAGHTMVFLVDLAAMSHQLSDFDASINYCDIFNKRIRFEVNIAKTRPDLLK